MARRPNTWWVDYTYDYDYPNEGGKLEHIHAGDGERFQCLKKEIKNKVKERVQGDFGGNEINLKITIIDCYITTDYEI